jgi:hypothetical protein
LEYHINSTSLTTKTDLIKVGFTVSSLQSTYPDKDGNSTLPDAIVLSDLYFLPGNQGSLIDHFPLISMEMLALASSICGVDS